MSIRADDMTRFKTETQEISCEKTEVRGSIAAAMLTSNKDFAAEINKFMIESESFYEF